ncbi:MAG: hypothetical protein CSA35_01190 [Dethiosulfovibrio peptidovorans]|nr:MAG: hypothetical protein CSA35_01190 [Dethiosulfovibrio peptidovorans]
MQSKQITVFILIIILIAVIKRRLLRCILFHIYIILTCIWAAIGLYFLGSYLSTKNSLLGSLIFFISFDFFLGALLWIYFTYRDSQGTNMKNIKEILSKNQRECIITRKNKILGPLLLIPRKSKSYTWTFIGRQPIKNICGFNFASLFITNERIFIQSILFGMPLLEIHMQDIEEVRLHDSFQGIITLEITKSSAGAYIKLFHHSANIEGVIYLNVGKHSEELKNLINTLSHPQVRKINMNIATSSCDALPSPYPDEHDGISLCI